MIPIFLINLDKSDDRLGVMAEKLADLGLGFTRIAAVDGRAINAPEHPNYDGATAWAKYGRPLSAGEIGCYLSHIAAAEAFLATGENIGLVLEDDVYFADGFLADLDRILMMLESSDQEGKWDIANLGKPARRFLADKTALPSGVRFGRACHFPTTTHALLWHRDGAKAFLDQCRTMSQPVDIALQQWSNRRGRGKGVSGALIPADNVQSVIAQMAGGQVKKTIARSKTHGLKRARLQAINYFWALRHYFGAQ